MKMVPLGEYMTARTGSLAPGNYPSEEFELYSIPAHDRGGSEVLRGSDIGSAKQLVQPGDVMISKIIPHIRRVRIVAPPSGRRQIASGEWIVLRSQDYDASYLRHFLLSNQFHAQFMNTVAGVGGSLVRARPQYVKAIEVPVPSLDEQRRIAAILNQAESLRAKRQQALAKFDELIQSRFQALVDFSVSRRTVPLDEAYWLQEGPGIRKWQFTSAGVKLLNVGNIEADGSINLAKTARYISQDEATGRYRHFLVDDGDLVIASSGISFDKDGLLRTRGGFVRSEHLPLCMNTSTIRFKAKEGVSDLVFLRSWLGSREFRTQITRLVTGSAQQNFGPSHLKKLVITLPDIDTQTAFARTIKAIERTKSVERTALEQVESLIAALQSRVFSGRL